MTLISYLGQNLPVDWFLIPTSSFLLQPFVSVPEQKDPDPDFPTAPFPNPEEGKTALNCAISAAESNGSQYILANDPDADRMAVAEKQEEYVTVLIVPKWEAWPSLFEGKILR